jgi:hypothetical protein
MVDFHGFSQLRPGATVKPSSMRTGPVGNGLAMLLVPPERTTSSDVSFKASLVVP